MEVIVEGSSEGNKQRVAGVELDTVDTTEVLVENSLSHFSAEAIGLEAELLVGNTVALGIEPSTVRVQEGVREAAEATVLFHVSVWREADGSFGHFFALGMDSLSVMNLTRAVAWTQVLGVFPVNMNNWGSVNSFGVYQAYYQTTLLRSHSPSAISWIGTVQGALLLLVGVVSGPLFDRGFFQATLFGAGLALVVALMLLSLATEYYQSCCARASSLACASACCSFPP